MRGGAGEDLLSEAAAASRLRPGDMASSARGGGSERGSASGSHIPLEDEEALLEALEGLGSGTEMDDSAYLDSQRGTGHHHHNNHQYHSEPQSDGGYTRWNEGRVGRTGSAEAEPDQHQQAGRGLGLGFRSSSEGGRPPADEYQSRQEQHGGSRMSSSTRTSPAHKGYGTDNSPLPPSARGRSSNRADGIASGPEDHQHHRSSAHRVGAGAAGARRTSRVRPSRGSSTGSSGSSGRHGSAGRRALLGLSDADDDEEDEDEFLTTVPPTASDVLSGEKPRQQRPVWRAPASENLKSDRVLWQSSLEESEFSGNEVSGPLEARRNLRSKLANARLSTPPEAVRSGSSSSSAAAARRKGVGLSDVVGEGPGAEVDRPRRRNSLDGENERKGEEDGSDRSVLDRRRLGYTSEGGEREVGRQAVQSSMGANEEGELGFESRGDMDSAREGGPQRMSKLARQVDDDEDDVEQGDPDGEAEGTGSPGESPGGSGLDRFGDPDPESSDGEPGKGRRAAEEEAAGKGAGASVAAASGDEDDDACFDRNLSLQHKKPAVEEISLDRNLSLQVMKKAEEGGGIGAAAVRRLTSLLKKPAPGNGGKRPPKPSRQEKPPPRHGGLEFGDLPAPKRVHFQFTEIQLATDNFQESNLLGQGGFGKVFFGLLPVKPTREIAVKVLRKSGSQADEEFKTELELLSRLEHKHLVKLWGFCMTAKHRLLVYEYLPNGSLYDHLHGKKRDENGPLSWDRRLRIAVGAARGLRYLHAQRPQVLHRDIKAANILLTNKLDAKVADFGCAKLIRQTTRVENENGEVVERLVESVDVAMGTHGLMAPEILMTGEISSAGDIYSFGVVLLELITGMQPILPDGKMLVHFAQPLLEEKKWTELVDPCILDTKGGVSGVVGIGFKAKISPNSALVKCAMLAESCIDFDPLARPSMDEVADALQAIYLDKESAPASTSAGSRSTQSGGTKVSPNTSDDDAAGSGSSSGAAGRRQGLAKSASTGGGGGREMDVDDEE